jgi:hypothetical protein
MKLALVVVAAGLFGVILGMSLAGTKSTSPKELTAILRDQAVADRAPRKLGKPLPAYPLESWTQDPGAPERAALRQGPAAGVPPASATSIMARVPTSKTGQTRAEKLVSAQLDAMVAEARNQGTDNETVGLDPTTPTQEVNPEHASLVVNRMIAGFTAGLAQLHGPAEGQPESGDGHE